MGGTAKQASREGELDSRHSLILLTERAYFSASGPYSGVRIRAGDTVLDWQGCGPMRARSDLRSLHKLHREYSERGVRKSSVAG